MDDAAYRKLAKVLDTLPNGFPATESGVEIKLLKKIFTPDEADLFCDLKLTFETVRQIAERSGRSQEGLEERLDRMRERGQIQGIQMGDVKVYRMLPWVFGIYEMQLPHLDKEFVEMFEDYHPVFSRQHFTQKPQQFQIIPVEEEEDFYRVIKEQCIGCGLCISTCPEEAIQLIHKQPEEISPPPPDEMSWFEERARQRGVDISQYK